MDREYEHEQYGHKIVYPFLENDYEAITVVNEIKWGSNIHNLYLVFFTNYIFNVPLLELILLWIPRNSLQSRQMGLNDSQGSKFCLFLNKNGNTHHSFQVFYPSLQKAVGHKQNERKDCLFTPMLPMWCDETSTFTLGSGLSLKWENWNPWNLVNLDFPESHKATIEKCKISGRTWKSTVSLRQGNSQAANGCYFTTL